MILSPRQLDDESGPADSRPNSALPERHPETEADFRTKFIRRGSKMLFAIGEGTHAWSVLGNTAQALLAPDAGVVEHYEARRDGIEVTWVFPQPLLGEGSLAIEAELSGFDFMAATASGSHFSDASGTARLRIDSDRGCNQAKQGSRIRSWRKSPGEAIEPKVRS